MIPTLSFWITLIGRLATEAGLLVALAAAAQAWIATPWRRRALWQTALLGIALTWSAEIGGLRQEILRRWPEPRPKTQVIVRSMAEPMPAFEPVLAPVNPAPEMRPPPAVVQQPVWWPLQLWAAGTGLLGLRSLSIRIWLLLAALRRKRVDDSELLGTVERLRARVGLRRVRVLSWPGLRSPIAFGFWTPTIALPAEFTSRFDDGAQEAILAHELAHLAARDPLWLGIADGVLALAWWHPGVWWSRHQLRAACESAADDASALVPGGRVRLAELLVSLGRDLVSPGWTRGLGVAGDGFKSQLAHRVTALLKASHDWRADRSSRMWWTRVAALGVTALLVAIPWPGTSGPALTALIQEARANAAESKEKPTSSASRWTPSIGFSKAYLEPRWILGDESTNAIGYQQYSVLSDPGGQVGQSMSVGLSSSNWLPGVSSSYVSLSQPGFTTSPLPPPAPSAWPGEAWVNAQLDRLILPEVELLRGTVSSALEKLSLLSRKADPKGLGLNLLMVHDEERPPVSTALVRERIQLRQVTLREALRAVAKASTIPLGEVVDQQFGYLERTRPGKVLGQTLIRVRSIPVHGPAFSEYLTGRNFTGATNVTSAFVGFCRSEGITNQLWYPPGLSNLPTTLFVEFMESIQIVGTASEIERLTSAVDRLHLPPPTVRGRDAVNSKLDQIILPTFAIGYREPTTIVADLVAASRKLDSDHRGISIIALIGGWSFEPKDKAGVTRVEHNLSLRQALQKVIASFSVAPNGELAFETTDEGVSISVRNSTGPAFSPVAVGDHYEILPLAPVQPSEERIMAPFEERPGDSVGQSLMRARIHSILVPRYEFGWRSLDAAVERLHAFVLAADPEKRGINFSVESPNLQLPRGGNWSAGPLRFALDQLVDACSTPVDWSVREDAIVFKKTANGERPSRSRWWLVDTNAFWAMVRSSRPPRFRCFRPVRRGAGVFCDAGDLISANRGGFDVLRDHCGHGPESPLFLRIRQAYGSGQGVGVGSSGSDPCAGEGETNFPGCCGPCVEECRVVVIYKQCLAG